jgi:tetratricopeptide (TPR) repeat protein
VRMIGMPPFLRSFSREQGGQALPLRICECMSLHNLSVYHICRTRPKAIVCLVLARERSQDVYDPYAEGVTEWSLGLAYTQQGNLLHAKRALTQALHRFEQYDATPLVTRVRAHLGQVLLEQQHEEEAEVMLRQALGGAKRLGDPQTRAEALEGLARLHLARGKAEHAIRLIQTGIALLQETRDQPLAGQLHLTLARAYEAQYDQEAAEEAFKTAISLFHSTPHRGLIIRAHECYGQFLANQRRFREAYEQMEFCHVEHSWRTGFCGAGTSQGYAPL